MTCLLKIQLENARNRYETLIKTRRSDTVARIVLDRMKEEINSLERSIRDEEKPRKEVGARASTGRFTQCFRKIMLRYWPKCYGDHRAIPRIPASETL
jgi:hypothetical protein